MPVSLVACGAVQPTPLQLNSIRWLSVGLSLRLRLFRQAAGPVSLRLTLDPLRHQPLLLLSIANLELLYRLLDRLLFVLGFDVADVSAVP
jgi:hypothetical protein